MLTNVMIVKTVKQHLYYRLARLIDYCSLHGNRVPHHDLEGVYMNEKLPL